MVIIVISGMLRKSHGRGLWGSWHWRKQLLMLADVETNPGPSIYDKCVLHTVSIATSTHPPHAKPDFFVRYMYTMSFVLCSVVFV